MNESLKICEEYRKTYNRGKNYLANIGIEIKLGEILGSYRT